MKKSFYYIALVAAWAICVMPSISAAEKPSFGAPIVDAADRGDINQVERLIKEGAFVDEAGDFKVTALMRAAFRGKKEIAGMLIKAGADVNARDIGGASPMHMAARAGKTEIIALLLEHKAEVDIKDEEGWTPLMRASNAGKDDAVQALLKSGANPNQKNAWDESSLIYAVKRGNVKVASALLESGAKTEGKDADGRSITQLAEISKSSEIKTLLNAPAPVAAPIAQQPVVIAKPETIAVQTEPAKPATTPQPAAVQQQVAPEPAASTTQPTTVQQAEPAAKSDGKPLWKKIFRDKGEPAPVEVIAGTSSTPAAVTPTAPAPVPAVLPAAAPVVEAKKTEQPITPPSPKVQQPVERNFLIQIGFFQETDKDKAGSRMHQIWSEKSKANPDVFANLTPVVTGVKLYGQEDLYRIRAGYFASRSDAESVCKKLGGIEQGCVVIKASATDEERSLESEKALMEISSKKLPEQKEETKQDPVIKAEPVIQKPAPEISKQNIAAPIVQTEPKGKIESAMVEKLQSSPEKAAPASKPTVTAPPAISPKAEPIAPVAKAVSPKLAKAKKPKDEVSLTQELNNKQLGGSVSRPLPATDKPAETAKIQSKPVEVKSEILNTAPAKPVEQPIQKKPAEAKKQKPVMKPEKEVEATKELNNKQISGAIQTPPAAPAAPIAAPAKPESMPAPKQPAPVILKSSKQSEEEKTRALNSKQLEAKPQTENIITPQAAPSTTPAPIKKIEEAQAQTPKQTEKFLDQQPVRPATEGEVEVKEAIRVPLSGSNTNKPKYFIAAEKPNYSYGDIVVEIFWFDTEDAAKLFAGDLKANRADLLDDVNASTKPHDSGKFILSLGAFGTVGESQEVCRIAKSAGLYCTSQKVMTGIPAVSNSANSMGATGGSSGRFWALLGGYQTGREAVEAYDSLTPAIPAEFKSVGHEVKVSRAGRNKVYRLKAGHFTSRATAEKFCDAVESRADLCQVVEE